MVAADRVAVLRAHLGRISQGDLALLLGIARSTVARWENGTREPDLNTLSILHDIGVSLEWLAGKSDILLQAGKDYEELKASVRARLDELQAQAAQ